MMAAGVFVWTAAVFHVVDAKEAKSDNRRLIQVTEPDEEYRSMLELHLLEYEGSMFTKLVNVSEYESDDSTARNMMSAEMSGSVVQIVSDNLLGSGVIIEMTETEVVLVSAKHVLKDHDSVKVTFGLSDGRTLTVEGSVLGVSSEYDLFYITIPVADIGYDFVTKLRYHAMKEEHFENLRAGDTVIQIGSTDGPAQDVYQGTVESKWVFVSEFNSYMMFHECIARPGMSGGAAFNQSGELVGIITGADETTTVCMPVNLGAEEYRKLKER